MPENERNQLALDNYKKRTKSNWEIGIEYEMYIGYLLREGKIIEGQKLNVDQFGERHGLNDLGRDIIASTISNKGEITYYVIQCKRWANDRMIHENTICQLYGTTIEFKLSKNLVFSTKVIPILISTTYLSPTAQQFADKLGVEYKLIEMGDYPMIKCNINNGNKIYHLPFDQQYYRTEIKLPGEFYARTVQEAVDAGFRRARRHMFNE